MKKIILKEGQVKKLMDNIVSEQHIDNNKYSQDVSCSFSHYGLTFKGNEIDWITNVKFNVSFSIKMKVESYGIEDLIIHNFDGPKEIEISVAHYPEGSDIPVEDIINIQIDWSNVSTAEANIGWIGIDDDIEMDLRNDESGNLVFAGLLIPIKGL